MAIGVLILGESGSGKSFSMRNFTSEELKVISVEKPILPFKNHFEVIRSNDVKQIIKELKATDKKRVVVDDFQYILGLAAMRRSLEKGWDKFSEMQYDYFQILDALKELPDDMIVYFMSHTETDENGVTKIKTIGKALDKYITIEGLFMIVLGTRVSDGNYFFTTQTNGKDTIKTPAGMFPSYAIDNDLKYVDEKIRNYYEIGEFLTDEEMKAIDEAAKKEDIPIKEEKKGRRRNAKKEEKPTDTPSEKEKEEGAPKTRSRRSGTKDTTHNDGGTTDGQTADTENGKPTRRKSRAEVERENELTVAEAGTTEDGEPIDMTETEVKVPAPQPLPRKTRKERMEEKAEPAEEKPATRRRRKKTE